MSPKGLTSDERRKIARSFIRSAAASPIFIYGPRSQHFPHAVQANRTTLSLS
jgi:hypothetical protein